jgi:hypothetical protein
MPWRQLACLLDGQEMEHPAHFAVRGVEQEFPPPHANGFHPPSITQVERLPQTLGHLFRASQQVARAPVTGRLRPIRWPVVCSPEMTGEDDLWPLQPLEADGRHNG